MNSKDRAFSSISAKAVLRKDYMRKDGTCAIVLQVYVDKARVRQQLGVHALPRNWHVDRMEVHARDPQAEDKNMIIRAALGKCSEIATRCRLSNEHITTSQFNRMYARDESHSFLDFWREKIEEMRPQMAPGTYTHHRTVLRKLVAWRGDLSFGEIDHALLQSFDRHLRSAHGNNHNTRGANMKKFRKWVNVARMEGRMSTDPFQHYQITEVPAHRIALRIEQVRELVQLWQRHTLGPGRQHALQNFLLGCFTGLRISDIYRVRKDQIVDGFLIFTPQKTSYRGKVISIPLTAAARRFVSQVDTEHIGAPLSDAKTNAYLKDIAALTGLPRNITFKASRHTFATIYLELGGKVETLQQILGHANIRTTMVYVHISEARKASEMAQFDNVDWFGSGAK